MCEIVDSKKVGHIGAGALANNSTQAEPEAILLATGRLYTILARLKPREVHDFIVHKQITSSSTAITEPFEAK